MSKIRLGEKEKEIIKTVALGLLIIGSMAFPGLPIALKPLLGNRGPKKFHRTLKKLEEKGVIYLGGEKVQLTKKGKKIYHEIQFKEINIEQPELWNKVWHLVSYDVPEKFKKERDWFRWTLKKWGFYQIQKSLWVHAYECKQEVAVISQNLKISPYVIHMQTGYLPNQKKLEKYFCLTDDEDINKTGTKA